jgi:hypothetical protein
MDISLKPREISMTTLTIGKRLVPLEHIVLVEPFDPSTQTRMQSDKPFQTRIVLLDRENILAEEALATFVDKHGFRRLSEDGIAINPGISWRKYGSALREREVSLLLEHPRRSEHPTLGPQPQAPQVR